MVILLTLQRGDCTPRKGARLSKSAHIRCVIPAVATVSAGRTIATKKAPRRSAGLSCLCGTLCKRSQAQSTASLAQVRALGERLPSRRLFSCNHSSENDEFIPPSEIGELGTPHRVRTSPSAINPTGLPVGPFYFLPHQSKMPPMRPPVSNAFFCFASRLS
jgi:hypothetical protein